MNNRNKLNVLELLTGCQRRKADGSHEPFCFELFRRAIVERDDASWTAVYKHYYGYVRGWVRKATVPDDDDVDDLVQDALISFWNTYKQEQFSKAKTVGHVLGYLKSCAKTAVLQRARTKSRRAQTVGMSEEIEAVLPHVENVEKWVSSTLQQDEIWTLVDETCKSDQDRAIMDGIFKRGATPADIFALYPDLFADVDEVYKVKRNMWNRLRRNTNLQAMCENVTKRY